MSARDRILARVHKSTGGPALPPTVVPALARTSGLVRISQFISKVEASAATISRVSAMADIPRALAHELRSRNLPASIRHGADPAFRSLHWGTIESSEGPGRLEEPVTLSQAEMGMAETGTLVLVSGKDNPVTLTFLGETHFIVLGESDLMAGFEDMWAAFRQRGLDPRTVNLVTGPSRSADIGQKLQLGAHGPMAVHVFLVAQ